MQKSELNIHDLEHFQKVMAFALEKGKIREFITGVNYLATYAEGNQYDQKVCVDIYPDPSVNEHSMVANIFRFVPDYEDHTWYKKRIITIGMVWFDKDQNWSFHS